jgi:hypothetical protein
MCRRAAKRREGFHPGAVAAAPLTVLALLLPAAGTRAQDLEPRAYINTPVGLNFLIVAYGYSDGGLSTDPTLEVEDARLQVSSVALAYSRSLDLGGKSGRIDATLPFSQLTGSALVAGHSMHRDATGLGDPRIRLAINFYGAPALSLREFAGYKRDLVIGASIQVTAPGSQYDPNKLVNLATNRWSVKPDIGLSKALGPLTLDLTTGVIFYTDNNDFFGGKTLQKEPVYSVQTNASYSFRGGIWAAFGVTYYRGGRTTVNGAQNNDELSNSRAGATLTLPVDKRQSVKFNASHGVTTRAGTSFTTVGFAWQYRWGAGL